MLTTMLKRKIEIENTLLKQYFTYQKRNAFLSSVMRSEVKQV